jgi:hypothetical protein
MDGKIRELWLIIECPHCMSPQTVRKHVHNNKVANIIKPRYEECAKCFGNIFLKLEEEVYEVS